MYIINLDLHHLSRTIFYQHPRMSCAKQYGSMTHMFTFLQSANVSLYYRDLTSELSCGSSMAAGTCIYHLYSPRREKTTVNCVLPRFWSLKDKDYVIHREIFEDTLREHRKAEVFHLGKLSPCQCLSFVRDGHTHLCNSTLFIDFFKEAARNILQYKCRLQAWFRKANLKREQNVALGL